MYHPTQLPQMTRMTQISQVTLMTQMAQVSPMTQMAHMIQMTYDLYEFNVSDDPDGLQAPEESTDRVDLDRWISWLRHTGGRVRGPHESDDSDE